jgi:hypothetical protein
LQDLTATINASVPAKETTLETHLLVVQGSVKSIVSVPIQKLVEITSVWTHVDPEYVALMLNVVQTITTQFVPVFETTLEIPSEDATLVSRYMVA